MAVNDHNLLSDLDTVSHAIEEYLFLIELEPPYVGFTSGCLHVVLIKELHRCVRSLLEQKSVSLGDSAHE